MFVDKANIQLKAGKGGDGAVAFRKEKYVPAGGPSGGDGGKGGDIIFEVDEGMRTLMDFRYKKHYVADNGENGKNKNMYGKDAEDLILKVPPGTIIRDEKSGRIIADLVKTDDRKVVAKGGKGGKGNIHFRSSTRQAPRFAIAGEFGDELTIVLELKMIADIGLIGFPNVGKSTILSVVTSANPKVADYHFTTLTPNLGLVKTKHGDSFVLADIPGLIEGAHEGTGLGHEFLRHVERTKLLIHVIDIAALEGRNPMEDFHKINQELKLYSPKLAEKPQIVAANKMDITESKDNFNLLKEKVKEMGIEIFPISAVTNTGLEELFIFAAKKLKEVEENYKEQDFEDTETNERIYKYNIEEKNQFTVSKENDIFIIEGKFIERLINSTNLDNMDSLSYFQKVLKKKGVIDELKALGIKDGDTVKINDVEFEYYD